MPTNLYTCVFTNYFFKNQTSILPFTNKIIKKKGFFKKYLVSSRELSLHMFFTNYFFKLQTSILSFTNKIIKNKLFINRNMKTGPIKTKVHTRPSAYPFSGFQIFTNLTYIYIWVFSSF